MRFFIPAADSPEQEARVLSAIIQHNGLRATVRKARSLCWDHNGSRYTAEVGECTSFNHEIVVAILFDDQVGPDGLFYVCTAERGVIRGSPVMAGKRACVSWKFFDE